MTPRDPADPNWLLTEACDVVDMIVAEVGAPEACLRLGAVSPGKGGRVRDLLSALEAFVRRILVIMAFALLGDAPRPVSKPVRKAPPARKPQPNPSEWIDPQLRFDRHLASLGKAKFRMLTSQVHPWESDGYFIERHGDDWRSPPRASLGFVRTERLARRFAAVVRVLADPEPFAKRLASRLGSLDRPHGVRELSRTAAHLDIDVTVWPRGASKSRERRLIERHPCRRGHIAASAKCFALARRFWRVDLPYLAGG